MAGIAEALATEGMSFDDITLVEVPCTRMDGFRAAKNMMILDPPPTAIVALSDILAIGALDALHDLGVAVPGEVSVTGFDDQPEAQWVRPRLTTVRQPIQAKGRVAGDFLVAEIRGEDQHPHHILHTALIIRESTGPASPA
jgi:DNA-binding LacI/PurR family transcriptional regulator